jgi:uncharacterized protein YbbK (DUF523 family)
VLDGRCRVLNRDGEDVTGRFIRGAEETLRIARALGADGFIARSRSPSCGCGRIYDGSFSGRLVVGEGVTTALLRRNGFTITPEEHL